MSLKKKRFSLSTIHDARSTKESGRVYLAGAGPGDPGLLTLKTAALLKTADAVVYDGLVNPLLVQGLSAKLWNVSKHFPIRTAKHGSDQKEINQLLVKLARQGKTVVRLKGGDPFVFGRGGEEASFLKKNKIKFEVVPGVSAGNAVPAYAGIPITDRRLASAVTFVTSHEDPAKKNGLDWNAVARLGGTLVFFMGWKNLAEVSKRLMKEGLSADTPAAAIQWGTMPSQRVVEGSLKDIAKRVARAGLRPPALIVIGQTVKLRQELDWFKQKPLLGKKIVITRSTRQSRDLACRLSSEGAQPLWCPVIEMMEPKSFSALDQALQSLTRFDWIVFTSTNAVEAFFKRLEFLGMDARSLSGVKLAVMGPSTEVSLKERGLRPDLIPAKFEAAELVKLFKNKRDIRGKHILLPRTDIAPPELARQLKEAGAHVSAVTAYRTVQSQAIAQQVRRTVGEGEPDYVLFASASAARYFFNALPRQFWGKIKKRLISIGPATTRALKELGLKPLVEAREHTAQGMVDELIRKKGKGKRGK